MNIIMSLVFFIILGVVLYLILGKKDPEFRDRAIAAILAFVAGAAAWFHDAISHIGGG